MGERTGIAWCDHTFNPWRGCTKVSAGCANCYAEALSKRNPAVLGEWGPEGKRVVGKDAYWSKPFAWDRAAERDGVRRKVFCASLADVFEDRPELDAQRDRLHATIALTPNLDWLLVTKRPAEARRYYAAPDRYKRVLRAAEEWRHSAPGLARIPISNPAASQGYRNRWLGVSVEDQKTADERIPLLLEVPAAVRFVSYEPALGPVSFDRLAGEEGSRLDALRGRHFVEGRNEPLPAPRIDWLIVGGESGPKARPFDIAWARSVVEQCRAAGVACFVKQLGDRAMCRADSLEGRRAGDHPERDWPIGTLFGTAPGHMGTEWQGRHAQGKAPYENGRCVGRPVRLARACSDPAEWPEDLRVREFPEVRRG